MTEPAVAAILARLDAIAAGLAADPDALALIGLGSVGWERDRLDAFSDLDFFAIVREGSKHRFLADLRWLGTACAPACLFRNTVDGFKCLYEDGLFAEFAVFEPRELAGIPYAAGRIVWKRDGVDDSLANPVRPPPAPPQHGVDWLLGEALTNVYVGLCRFRRGERLSAARFVQQYAVDRVIDLCEVEADPRIARDAFSPERRAELRFPALAPWWPRLTPGCDRTPEAALAVLEFLEARHRVPAAMARAIRRLAGPGPWPGPG